MTIKTPPKPRTKSVADRGDFTPPLDRITGSSSPNLNHGKNQAVDSEIKLTETAYRFFLQDVARKLKPNSRLIICLRHKIPGRELVEIWRDPEKQKAYYQNLMTCGRVFLCPVCASRITERRRKALAELLGQGDVIEIPEAGGGIKKVVIPRWHMAMATYTIQHSKEESAVVVLDRLSRAYHKFWSNGGITVNGLRQRYHIIGTLRALEPLYNERNGFHFHYHVLYISDSQFVPMVEAQLHFALGTRWLESVAKVGGFASIDAFDFQAGDSSLADYLNKIGQIVGEAAKSWGQLSEVTKYPVKRSNKSGLTLWELLDAYSKGDKRAGAVWAELVDALKGKTYLNVSSGLLARLGADSDLASDQKMAEPEVGDFDALFAAIGDQSWKLIKMHGKRSEVLDKAGSGDVEQFQKYLESIEGKLTSGDVDSGVLSETAINAGQGVIYGDQSTNEGEDLDNVLW